MLKAQLLPELATYLISALACLNRNEFSKKIISRYTRIALIMRTWALWVEWQTKDVEESLFVCEKKKGRMKHKT